MEAKKVEILMEEILRAIKRMDNRSEKHPCISNNPNNNNLSIIDNKRLK